MAQPGTAIVHVLVVDDDNGIRQTIADILESEGYTVATAANGRDALDRIAERTPALVLLDLQMPVMTGWEVLGHMRDQGVRVPVVFMTAGYRAQTEARAHNAEGSLGKPFEMDDLLNLVARFAGQPPSAANA